MIFKHGSIAWKKVEVLNFVGSFAFENQMASFLSLMHTSSKIYFDKQAYTEVNLNGRKAHHSALPTNPDLVKQLSLFWIYNKHFGYEFLFVFATLGKYGTFLVAITHT